MGQFSIVFRDAKNMWAVMSDAPKGKIGYDYKFKPMNATIIEDAYDAYDLDCHNTRKVKKPIPKGTRVVVDCWWQNFYGSYFKINYNGSNYDVKTSYVEID